MIFCSIRASCFAQFQYYSPQATSAVVPQGSHSIFNFNTTLVFKIIHAAQRKRNVGRLSQPENVITQHNPTCK